MYLLTLKDKKELKHNLCVKCTVDTECAECWEEFFDERFVEIDFKSYQELAMRTAKLDTHNNANNMLNACLGLCGESGEVADLIKKHLFQEHPLKKEKIIEEIGDVMWYIALMAKTLGTTLDIIAQKNIEKLEKRFPKNIFDKSDSINNRDKE